MTKKKLLIFLIITTLFLGSFSFAQENRGKALEVEYPEIEGEKPETTTTQVPEYVKYIFNFLIWISGVVALGVLIYAGFQYFTSTGNPEAINDAKDRIRAALLGLLILFGSYLILISINPDLVVFNLKRLKPIISELSPGILVCQGEEEPPTNEIWNFVNEFKFKNPTKERELEIKQELDKLFDEISSRCYFVLTAGDIMVDFDNKITYIYSIPKVKYDEEGNVISSLDYGAVIYEGRNFSGNSTIFYMHFFTNPMSGPAPEKVDVLGFGVEVSSIEPFILIPDPDPNWEITLYKEYNYSELFPYNSFQLDPDAWVKDVQPLPFSPKSIKIEGDLLAVLIAIDSETKDAKSEVFFNETDSNLEDNLNIVEWVDCKEYQSETSKDCQRAVTTAMGSAIYSYKCCAQAAATRMIIISAAPY